MTEKTKTDYNLTKRVSTEEIVKENAFVKSLENFKDVFNSLSTVAFVLNENRQLIFASNDFRKTMNVDDDSILGFRLGEIISCIHASETPDRCGTADACQYCGILNAFLECQEKEEKVQKESRITTLNNGNLIAWDLMISAFPITLDNKNYYTITIEDISAKKKISNLENIFLHDLINIAGNINNFSEMLSEISDPEKKNKIINIIHSSSQELLDQIIAHKHLKSAEDGNLKVICNIESSTKIIKSIINLVLNNKEIGNVISLDEESDGIMISTDKTILSRILLNMITNAIEANKNTGSAIKVGAKKIKKLVRFWVKSDKLIPKEIQLQIFQRSFSTKGEGRGLGTYSIKLLGETYLKGKVGFISNATNRTTFYIDLPNKLTGSN